MGFWVSGLLLRRAWRTHGGVLLLAMAAAFWLLSFHWGLLATLALSEHHPLVYGLRLLAFLVILGAIIATNWPARDKPPT